MAKKGKDKDDRSDEVVDLMSRIGARPPVSRPPQDPEDRPPARVDGPLPPRRAPEPRAEPSPIEDRMASLPAQEEEKTEAIPSPRTPPAIGETDVVITPLPTLDDWHRFELALRRVRGVTQVKTEYYRHGVLKVRVSYEGEGRLSQALRSGVPGYRVRVIGEGQASLQILVSSDSEERRPG